jgi:hypothetical protein
VEWSGAVAVVMVEMVVVVVENTVNMKLHSSLEGNFLVS